MASAAFEEAQRHLLNARAAKELHVKALTAFEAACIASDYELADQMRAEAIGHMEAWLDHMMAAHRRVKER